MDITFAGYCTRILISVNGFDILTKNLEDSVHSKFAVTVTIVYTIKLK